MIWTVVGGVILAHVIEFLGFCLFSVIISWFD